MSLKQSYYRYRITFEKAGAARFIGHLDLQSLFQKAIKRAKLPIAYSEGFNPHQLLSFAAPLPLGMASKAEILEIFLIHEMPVFDIITVLNSQMPSGLSVIGVQEVSAIGKSAAALVRKAVYSITFSDSLDLDEIVNRVMKSESIEVKRKSKKGMAVIDIRADIFSLHVASQRSLHAVLACGSERNLKPEILVNYLLEVSEKAPKDFDITYERLDTILQSNFL